jgi:hypothetical protein
MNNEADTLTRKEIADLIGKSLNFIRLREDDLGLRKCRANSISKKPILFDKPAVIAQMKTLGLLK